MMKTRIKKRINIISLFFLSILFIAVLVMINSCNNEGRGFALPVGDPEDGRRLFLEHACDHCHSVSDIEWKGDGSKDVHVALGGEVGKVKTYGDLVTSIINPSHRISDRFFDEVASKEAQSPMPFYNNILTVDELVDIVTYLEKQYKLVKPATNYYPYH